MKKPILILLLAIAFIGCKKDPMYYPKPSEGVFQIISKTNGLMVHLYDYKGGSNGYQLDKDKKEEHPIVGTDRVKVECPSGNCTYYFNGIKFHQTKEFGSGSYR